MKFDRFGEVLAKIVHHGKKGFKKVYSQVSKGGVTKKIRKHPYMASYVSEMKQLRKFKKVIVKIEEFVSLKE